MSQTTPTTPPTGPVRPWRPTPGPWQPTVTPITVRIKACCGDRLVRERCDCRAVRRQLRRAPVLHVTTRRAAA